MQHKLNERPIDVTAPLFRFVCSLNRITLQNKKGKASAKPFK